MSTEVVAPVPPSAEEKLGFAVASFFSSYPLYYYILSSLARVRTTSIPTMGVGFGRDSIVCLYYNPAFVSSLSGGDLRSVLHHECLHLGLKHLQRGKGHIPKLANIAMDVSINAFITDMSDDMKAVCMTQDKFEALNDKDLREMAWEEVYDLIKPEYDKAKEKFEEMMKNASSHKMWDGEGGEGGQGGLSPIEDAALNDVLKNAAKSLGGRDPGNIPGSLRRELDKLLTSKYDWRKALSIFAQSIAMEEKIPTWKRPSRRFGVISPGHKKDFRPRLLCVVDNSGSISEDIYKLFMSQIIKISETCEEIAIIGVDTRVNFEGKIEKGKAPKFEDLQSGGGTEFQPAFDYAKQHEFDGVIYFTDGYCFDDWVSHGISVIFALCEGAKEISGHRNIHIEKID